MLEPKFEKDSADIYWTVQGGKLLWNTAPIPGCWFPVEDMRDLDVTHERARLWLDLFHWTEVAATAWPLGTVVKISSSSWFHRGEVGKVAAVTLGICNRDGDYIPEYYVEVGGEFSWWPEYLLRRLDATP
jgi:hypothetical protein